jgi:uncharacterized protein YdbL (DUF1318 family)
MTEFQILAKAYDVACWDSAWNRAAKIKAKIQALGYSRMVDGKWVK